jgi:hypothetical protein
MVDQRFAWFESMPGQQLPIYMVGAYQDLLAQYDGCAARVLACRFGERTFFLPLLVRELGGGATEAYSAYGYGGLWGQDPLSADEVDALRAFLAAESVLCVFLRHSPFLANQHLLPNELVELNRRTYAVALARHEEFDGYLAGIAQKCRWAANYARRAGLQVRFTPLAEDAGGAVASFYDLYADLMRKKDTGKYYLFSESFFQQHARLGEQCELVEVIDTGSGRLLAGAFFLLDDNGWAHYHLSAAEPEAMKLQGMELLMASAIFRYGNMGYRALHLGGGHALDESDGLSRFKSKFASDRLDFYCSKLVCDPARYQAERARSPLAHPQFFLVADARGN